MRYLNLLIESAQKALSSIPTGERVIFSLNEINSIDINRGIYIIEQTNKDFETTFQAFKTHKQKQCASMPAINKPNKIMYVGSSRSSLKQRLLQHAGFGYKGTYALHLKDWFDGDVKITIKSYDVSDDVLQLIEDALAFELQPAFGKRGGNT